MVSSHIRSHAVRLTSLLRRPLGYNAGEHVLWVCVRAYMYQQRQRVKHNPPFSVLTRLSAIDTSSIHALNSLGGNLQGTTELGTKAIMQDNLGKS